MVFRQGYWYGGGTVPPKEYLFLQAGNRRRYSALAVPLKQEPLKSRNCQIRNFSTFSQEKFGRKERKH